MPSEVIKRRAAMMIRYHPDRDALIQEMREMVTGLRKRQREIDELLWEGEEVLKALETIDGE